MKAKFAAVLYAVAALSVPSEARAGTIRPGNFLVALNDSGVLREYTPAGAVVQSFTFPDFEGGFHDLRDVVVGPDGNVYAYNGTFTPRMSKLVPSTGTITNQSYAGWSTANNVSYGGIGVFGSGVFVTDMTTAGATEKGIVRFGTTGGSPVRFATDNDYQDLTIGGDGRLYALRGSTIDVFDPSNNSFVRTFTLASPIDGSDVRGIAVSASGNVYAAAWDGSIYAATPSGAFINSRATGGGNLQDIDINDAGQLLVGTRFGQVILTDTTLASQSSFTITGEPNLHVAFGSPLTVPEPSGAILVALAAGAAAARRRGRDRG